MDSTRRGRRGRPKPRAGNAQAPIENASYRYTLSRDIGRHSPGLFEAGSTPGPQRVLFCMLNPSTANDLTDDPTVRRCIGFARRWKARELCVVNLFAARATDPRQLRRMADPVGAINDDVIRHEARTADLVVAAWGRHGSYLGRDQVVLEILSRQGDVWALGLTADGAPKHPLYVRGDAVLRKIGTSPEQH